MSGFDFQHLFNQLKVDEEDCKVKKRRALLETKLSYLNQFRSFVSRESLMDYLNETDSLGQGAFGQVFQVKHRGSKFALKLI
jgi:hypothetical protein